MILYKFLVKYLKTISNPRFNTLKLSSWEATKKDENFKRLSEDHAKKVIDYHNHYVEATKSFAPADVKHISWLFPELQTEAQLNSAFYCNF